MPRRIVMVIVDVVILTVVGCAPDVRAEPAGSPPPSTRSSPPGSDSALHGATEPNYRPPVDAPVLDGFRPPPGPFAAGNRGIEYETESGTAVGAIGAGRVVFAGPVAGALHATIHHPDGLRSSYSYLATIAVAIGERVEAGGFVGTTTDRLHLGVRAGEGYLDPAALFGGDTVHLVPVP